ncbi:formate dehydrogenase accessory sulfurtransferase FdhD [Pusillimonas sp. NJUB218]|uniref:formate dehydrogenase accessory sulfurtransferase FdhD n=1 Tax=Pusillimonas sp. NJUB218 TaxID=2023230 RepID=UPI000F4CA964|nr:formate dehydrogenase accessory sulfurtransferase FdhD [Pusillimonas sp. NJUB218]ROT45416.1 sulfurtransferase FdhD [Pusillimonas sp. NJUB218]
MTHPASTPASPITGAPAPATGGGVSSTVWRYSAGAAELHAETDVLANEMAIALEYNGISHATVLATPLNLEDLAYGFSLTEGIIRRPADIYDIETREQDNGIVIQVTIASACINELKQRRRNLAGRTGCGLCGLESLGDVERKLPALPNPSTRISPRAVLAAAGRLRDSQPVHAQTGATHAAAWADAQGQLLSVREDVGRHNAFDKLIGHLAKQGQETTDGFAVISSRASFEMVQKAAAAGIGTVVAVSAPTHYATQMAHNLNVLLLGFTRQNSFTVYAHPEYLSSEGSPS